MVTDGYEGCATMLEECQRAGETVKLSTLNVLIKQRGGWVVVAMLSLRHAAVLVTNVPVSDYHFPGLHAGHTDCIAVVLPHFKAL